MVRDPFAEGTEPELTTVLEALCDDDCREIAETVESAMTASELSEACDVPLSTTYRKLDTMTEATLLEESIEIRADGRHTSRYRLAFEEVLLSIDEDRRFELTITRPARTADERLASLWSEVKEGL
ncbi:helix-turn-helix domain-containing protein [Halalkalicoccus subterraneus]|uniref:helix-turn-helix domain-containing protein n=1 Tax=Halalkalicoccus subterraneus TaxID=2675002 RepID=UPI000EFD6BC6|nr:helix-turn-helix domain-containing protein [Halalkalicoccus subterraneus]